MKTLFKLTLVILFCFYTFISCDDTDCITFSTRTLIIDFLDAETGDPLSRSFDWITATESGVLFYGDTTLSTLYLPINTDQAQTTFLFSNPDNSLDTLEIGYLKTERLISKDCGFELQFKNIEVISTTFGNVVIVKNELSRLNEQNIEIFL